MRWLTLSFLFCLLTWDPAFPSSPGGGLHAQEETDIGALEEESEEEEKPKRPASTDANSAKIISNHLKARGGAENIKSVRTLKITGRVKEHQKEYDVTWHYKAPDKCRVEYKNRHLGRQYYTVYGYDGKESWKMEILPEKKFPEPLQKLDMEEFITDAELHTPLVDYERKDHVFEYRGQVKKNKGDYVIKGWLAHRAEVYYYFDKKTFLARRVGFSENFAGRPRPSDWYPSKMKAINGALYVAERQYRIRGKTYKTETYETFEPNMEMPDSLFAKPEVREHWLRAR